MASLLSSLFKNNSDDIFTIAFYNVENLFDTKDDPKTHDDDYTSGGKRRWGYKRYNDKVKKLTSVISQLGTKRSKNPPAIVGLVEVENSQVVQDLVRHKNLARYHYDFVHYDSADERGIDVALLYNKQIFELLSSKTYPLYFDEEDGSRDYTRDVLRVTGNLKGERITILVNHWSSRRDGEEETRPKRIKAAVLNTTIIEEIKAEDAAAKIIIMGDFNDDPTSESVKKHLVGTDFYNPMESLFAKGIGTLTYNKKWNLFDQIILSKNFLNSEPGKLHFKHAEVFNKKWLRIAKGKLKGSPFRTFIGPWYKGGFSDHFPVYAYLVKEKQRDL